ncbi:MAG: ATP-binding protein [Armatimonadota bacterium]
MSKTMSSECRAARKAWPAEDPSSLAEQAGGWKTREYDVVSDPAVVSTVRQKVMGAALEAGARGDTLCDIQIAVGEALSNAYKHGSPHKGVSRIKVRCMSCRGALVVEVQDEGSPFDPDCTSAPHPHTMRDHGLGIYLMREAMDVVEFQCNCPGNRVRMIKWLKDR